MLITGHMRQIVQACHPRSPEEAIELWHNIKPVKFGDRHLWATSVNFQTLASYLIPEDAAYLLILKTECYVFTDTATAPGFRNFEPPPTGSGARWFVNNTTDLANALTGLIPIHILTDSSEFLMIKAGNTAILGAVLNSPPDANNRFICTTVYAYEISALIADRIGSGESFNGGSNT